MENNNQSKARPAGFSRAAKIMALVGSFVCSLLIWLYAIGYDSTLFEENFAGVEVTVIGEDELVKNKGYTLAREQYFSSITVTAQGKRSELNALTSDDFRAVVDVSKATKAGEQTIEITVESPNGVEVIWQSCTTASVFVDEFTQKSDLLSVTVDTGDNYVMTEGVTFVSSVANPMSVTVSGPKSVLAEIEGAYVNFNLDGNEISNNISGYGNIELRDANGKVINNPYVTISETNAYVTINVTKQKPVPVRLSFTGGMFGVSDLNPTVSAQSVLVSGSPDALNSINELVIEIDETAIDGTQTFEFPIASMLPAGVTNQSGSSKISVTVKMPELSVRNYTITSDRISVQNLPDGYEYNVKDDLQITVIGARDAFENFDSSLMTAVADFNKVTVNLDGSYTADVEINLGGEYIGIYVQSKSYNVTFTATPIATLPDISGEDSAANNHK